VLQAFLSSNPIALTISILLVAKKRAFLTSFISKIGFSSGFKNTKKNLGIFMANFLLQ